MKTSHSLAATLLNAGTALFNSGTLVFYSGTIPASPETALSGNTVLTTFTFAATAFAASTYSSPNEQAVASFTSPTSNPTSSGTATFARAFQSNGTTVIADFTVGTSAADIIIGNTGIQTGVPVTISSFILKLPAL